MKNRIEQLMEKLDAGKSSGNRTCDLNSSQVHIVNVPVPTKLFLDLQAMATEFNRDADCLAADFLELALEEAEASMSEDQKHHLDDVVHNQEREQAEKLQQRCGYDAGGT
jgi:hypothetical protein